MADREQAIDLVKRVGRLRAGELDDIAEEVKENDAILARVSIKHLLLRDADDGAALLAAGEAAWRPRGFETETELRIAMHAVKSSREAPVGMTAAFARHEARGRRGEVDRPSEAPSFPLPAPAVRTAEEEADAPEIEISPGGK